MRSSTLRTLTAIFVRLDLCIKPSALASLLFKISRVPSVIITNANLRLLALLRGGSRQGTSEAVNLECSVQLLGCQSGILNVFVFDCLNVFMSQNLRSLHLDLQVRTVLR